MLLQIKQWESKYIKDFDVVKNGEITPEALYNKLSAMYYEFVSENDIVPFVITYGGINGFVVNANSHVGAIVNGDITLYISSMIPELTLGKILYLQSQAEEVENESVTKQVLTEKLNDEEDIAAIDYFIVSLIDSIEDIKQRGLITELLDEKVVSSRIQGRLVLSEQIHKNPAYDLFHTEKTIASSNNILNKVIKTAVVKAIKSTKMEWLGSLLKNAEALFDDVDIINELNPADFPKVEEYTNIRRGDYEKAIRLSKFILFGFDPLEGDGASYFPEFIVDMNVVFEYYVTVSLERLFKNGFKKKALFSLGLSPDVPMDKKNIELDGFYQMGDKTVVLDTKNKYKSILDRDDPDFMAANPDIYQQYYYASRLNSSNIILVYPSSKKRTKPIGEYKFDFGDNKDITMYFWALYITGSPMENTKYLISLAKFIESL